jgi:hypothetical protein
MRVWLLLISLVFLANVAISKSTKQLIVVKTSSWSAKHGNLQRYEG